MSSAIHLDAKGPRQVVKAEDAQVILQEWKNKIAAAAPDAVVETLDISCRVWTSDVLELFREFFEEKVVPTVIHLKIDDIIASLETELGLQSLAFFADVFSAAPHLIRLNLDDNALGTRGTAILHPLIRPCLHELTLRNCGLARECFVTDNDTGSVAMFPQETTQLRILRLGKNQIGLGAEQVGDFIKTYCPYLEELAYDGCRPLREGTKLLCERLAEMTTPPGTTSACLRKINLQDVYLMSGEDEEDAVHDFCRFLLFCKSLEELNLEDCNLSSSGTRLVLEALAGRSLRVLALSGNELEVEGAEVLAEYFESNNMDELVELNLDTNEFEEEGLEHLLGFLRSTTSLKRLNLASNLLTKEAGLALLDKKFLCTLEHFDLKDNELSVKTAKRLRKMYPGVMTDPDDELAEDDDDEEEEDDDLGGLTQQLAGTEL